MTLECAGNGRLAMRPLPIGEPWGDLAVSTARWTGALLRDVLERASARETAARVAAGTVAKLLLAHIGVDILSHIVQMGKAKAHPPALPRIEDLATIDAGAMTLDLKPVDIRAAIDAAAEGLRDRIAEKDVRLDLRAPANIG